MINPQWLELPKSEQISNVPKMLELLKFDCISRLRFLSLLRHWLVTKDGNFLTMKDAPRLTLIKSKLQDNALCLDSDGMETLMLPLDPIIQPERVITVT